MSDEELIDLMAKAGAKAMAREQLKEVLSSGALAGQGSPEDLAAAAAGSEAELAVMLLADARVVAVAMLAAIRASGADIRSRLH